MCSMPTEGIKIHKHFRKNLGLYFTDGFGSDGSVVKGLTLKMVDPDTVLQQLSQSQKRR